MDDIRKIDFLLSIQEVLHSTAILAVMVDSTMRSVSEMYKWPYSTKHEMKHLGGTLFQMQEKFRELLILACAKMVDDTLNNTGSLLSKNLTLMSGESKNASFHREVDRLRHFANVIKHNNSVINSRSGASSKILVGEYGVPDDTHLQSLDQKYGNELRDNLLVSIFHSHRFCMTLLESLGFFQNESLYSEPDNIPEYMLNTFVRSLPGHPHK